MLQDIISKHRSAFAPGASTELRAQRNLQRRVVLQKGNMVGNVRADTAGVNARVYQNGLYGFSSSAELSDAAVKKALEKATYNANFLDKRVGLNKGALPALSQGTRPADKDMKDVSQKTYIDFLQAVDAHIAASYPGLISRVVVATSDSMEKIISTSDGYSAHIIAPRSYVYVILTAESKDGSPVELFKAFGGRGTFDQVFTNPEKLHQDIAALHERLMDKKEGVYAEAGLKDCILSGSLSGILAHEAVGHTVEADLVLSGSVAQHMLNKQVASPLVNMTDFAHTALGETAPLPVYVDDEGTLAQDAVLIENGILKGYMVNREMGARLNMQPLGNARAWSFSDEPLIRMRNTAVLPGKSKLSDMIAAIDDGYYLMETGNGQADMTGEFMFGVTMGYEIKKGKLGKALLDTTVSGIAFEMLKTVDMVSDNLTWTSSGFCGKKQIMPVGTGGPEMKCRITIGGR